ncbi:MAG: hypothetical protein H6806_04010 [Planctomycetes bacterium]|nr:hypothetical protein [Planctomycetota bacterium]MCB9828919.1 hypothetical protein [Planctomycetota bacterium]
MRALTTLLAVVLIALGVGLWLGTGRESMTALIPAFLGLGFGIAAAVASTPKRRMHAMHGAALLAMAGIAGGAMGVPSLIKHLGGEAIERPAAAWGRSVLAVLCLVYLVLAVRSFIQARRARTSGA